MSILSRLCRYVHTHGYSASPTVPAVPPSKRAALSSRRQRYARACIEEMEPRVLLTTITTSGNATQVLTFFDTAKKNFFVTVHGNTTVELYGAAAGSLVNLIPAAIPPATPPLAGVDIFAMYITSSDINSFVTVTGSTDIYTGGPGPLYAGTMNSNGLPVTVPTAAGQIWIGELTKVGNITNVPSITVTGGGGISLAAKALATSTTGFDGTNYFSGIYSANSIGKIFIDGTVTGNVAIKGSIGTFYAGWLITGDVTSGQNFNVIAQPDNFNVSGDIANLLVRTSVGTNVQAVPGNGFTYNTSTQIHVGGKLGTMTVGDTCAASVTADNIFSADSLVNLGFIWQKPTAFIAPANPANRVSNFELGTIPITANDPFFNRSFATATYVGTLDVTNNVRSITLNGIIQGFFAGQSPNPVDYYAFGLLAGQTVNVSEVSGLAGAQLGIFDPDGRLIFTSAVSAAGTTTATFTADRPGAYRVAVGLPGDLSLTGAASLFTDYNYSLNITGVGDLAIGGVHAETDLYSEGTGITATAGDIGVIAGDAQALSNTTASVNVSAGNLRSFTGGTIGHNSNANFSGFLVDYPTITVSGEIGLISSNSLLAANVFASRAIQVLNAGTDMEGSYISNQSMGVIRAGTMADLSTSTILGRTLFQVNADGIGSDGVIDLIDVTGDIGSLLRGGPRIDTGLGGNVRYMHVGGSIFQDPTFGSGGTLTPFNPITAPFGDGGIIHGVGEAVTLTDDSGSQVVLTPAPAQTITNPITKVVTIISPAGQLATYTYGIFGTGGEVIVKVISFNSAGTAASLTINSSSGNVGGGQSAEIGEIDMLGTGAALVTTNVGGTPVLNANGTPVLDANGTPIVTGGVLLPANNAAALATSLNTLSIIGTVATSVFSVNTPSPFSTTAANVLNKLTNNTGGDIVNINADDIGTLTVAGNLGSTHGTAGEAVNQSSVITNGNTYPFEQQHTGIVVGNVVAISTSNAVGNIMASGSVGTITADAGGGAVKGTLEGVTGPIVVDGNLGTINIGNGVGSDGLASFSATSTFGAAFSRAGIYVGGSLLNVVGNNADIRGQIITFNSLATTTPNSIGNITLTNGSLIGAEIASFSTLQMASYLSAGTVTLPELGGSVANPIFNIQKISITGNGGIIGTLIKAADIGTVTVDASGFGVINSDFVTLGDGVLKTLTAGGYGLRRVFFNGNKITALNATGSGAPVSVSQFSGRVRNSEAGTIDPYTGVAVSSDTDLTLFMKATGFGDTDYRTGVIGNSNFVGQNLGSITAFSMEGASTLGTTLADTLDFSNSIGSIKLSGGVTNIRILTGSLGSFLIGGDANGLDLEFAGTLGTMVIAGNYNSGLIFGKGPSSSIKSLTVAGNFAGTLISQGFVNTLIIGTAGNKKGVIGGGNFTGTIKLLGGSSVKNLVFASGFGGDFEIGGQVGSVTFLQGLGASSAFVVHGNLGKLIIGGDKTTNLGLAGHVTVQGTLGELIGGGAFTGSVATTGNLGKIIYSGNMGGSTTVNGGIGSFTLVGTLMGAIIANGSIGPIKITGNVNSNGSLTSNAGSISSMMIAKGGTLDGRVSAASIGKLIIPTMGPNSKITAGSLDTLTVQGNATGGTINIKGAISSLVVSGAVTGTKIISGSINKMTAAALTNAVVTAGQAINSLKVSGAVTSSVVQSGITAGNDGIFGTGDANELLSLGSLGTITVGSMVNSVVAAGGSIGAFTSGGLVDSSVSSGLVVSGAALQQVVAGTNPLATPANVQTLRSSPTLFFGNIGSVNIANGAEGGLDSNSAISAGVSPGPNGIFGDPSDSSIPPSAIGTSSIFKLKVAADALSRVFVHNPV